MAKSKKDKPKSVPNRHLYSRASYLFQASTFLQSKHSLVLQRDAIKTSDSCGGFQKSPVNQNEDNAVAHPNICIDKGATQPGSGACSDFRNNLSARQQRLFLGHVRTMILKNNNIHLGRELKRTTCKRCDTLLTPGMTCTSRIENFSKDGKKSWADSFTVTCSTCNSVKRFPVGVRRQPKNQTRKRQKFWAESGRSELTGQLLECAMACRRAI